MIDRCGGLWRWISHASTKFSSLARTGILVFETQLGRTKRLVPLVSGMVNSTRKTVYRRALGLDNIQQTTMVASLAGRYNDMPNTRLAASRI